MLHAATYHNRQGLWAQAGSERDGIIDLKAFAGSSKCGGMVRPPYHGISPSRPEPFATTEVDEAVLCTTHRRFLCGSIRLLL